MKDTVEIATIFPRFLYHKKWNELPEGFNERLLSLAIDDARAHRVPPEGHERAGGDKNTHISHLRHNFLTDVHDPVIARFVEMVDQCAREYLSSVYHYDHDGELELMGDTFWQVRERGENVGISCHTHFKSDLVVTYYARTGIEPKENNPLRQGSVRFYDPQNLGARHWPNNNPGVFSRAWYNIVPEVGSMLVFEGHIPHDSTFFGGPERLCIPVMCDVKTARSHIKSPVSDIKRMQGIGDGY